MNDEFFTLAELEAIALVGGELSTSRAVMAQRLRRFTELADRIRQEHALRDRLSETNRVVEDLRLLSQS